MRKIRWCTLNTFWFSVVLSEPTLRSVNVRNDALDFLGYQLWFGIPVDRKFKANIWDYASPTLLTVLWSYRFITLIKIKKVGSVGIILPTIHHSYTDQMIIQLSILVCGLEITNQLAGVALKGILCFWSITRNRMCFPSANEAYKNIYTLDKNFCMVKPNKGRKEQYLPDTGLETAVEHQKAWRN